VFLTHVFNGDNDTVVSRGDLLQLTIPNLDVAVGEDVIIKLIPSEGQALTMSFTVPDSLGNDLAAFT
jgi:archaellin